MNDTGISNLMIGLISGAIIAIVSFVLGLLGQLWYGRIQETRQRRIEALKKHFTQLQEQYIKHTSEFLANVSVQDGILFSNHEMDLSKTAWPINEYTGFPSFKVHFPIEANGLLKLKTTIEDSNEKNSSLNSELALSLTNKSNIPIRDYALGQSISKFYPIVITFLRFSFLEKLRLKSGDLGFGKQKYNFNEIKIFKTQYWINNINLFEIRLKDDRALAEVETTEQLETCRKALIEISEDNTFAQKVELLDELAKSQKKSLTDLSSSLNTICEIYGNFGSILKKKKPCPTCELIR